jgi:membrane protein YqaA with SNARE-associated domain
VHGGLNGPRQRALRVPTYMRAIFYSLLGHFLTPAGLILIAALDSSLIFFLPLGIDFVVIIVSARKPELFWACALMATAGSLIGAAATFWTGYLVGEHGLSRLVKPSRLERIQRRVNDRAALSVAALAVIPPPFPFTAFVLTSGAFRVNPWSFFPMLAAARLMRFGLESALAAHYGRGILVWMKSTVFEAIVAALILLAVVGTVVSAVALARGRAGSGRADPRSARSSGRQSM